MQRKILRKQYKKLDISAVRRIGFSFFVVILIGSFLLNLPISHHLHSTSSYLDHLFVATSATCVTGLVTHVTASEYTLFGQIIIILLIQIGGLGFLTLMSMFFVALKRKLTYANKIVMQEALNRNSLSETGIYIKRVIKYTAFFELLGAICLSFVFIPKFGIIRGAYFSLFHAISAFCNAGFDVLGNNSLVPYVGDIWINLVICGLIVAGGLGFVVWVDLRLSLIHYKEHFKYFKLKRYLESLSLHTKIVLVSTFVLIFGGMIVIFLLEFQNPLTLKSLPLSQKILASFFQSVTLRTAGFATVDMASLNQATKFFMSIVMFIGGSPAGTAGGVKTVTFVIGLLYVRSLIRGDENIHVFKRTIDDQIVKRALTIMLISFSIALIGLFVLSISESADFIDLLFEVFSAFATVGLTAGLTPTLTFVGKIVIIILMYIGRIGPITMVLIFVRKYNAKKGKDVNYITEHILIG
nr:TrkH family potassium uptake protein [uncultured Faecalibacillus sp.]